PPPGPDRQRGRDPPADGRVFESRLLPRGAGRPRATGAATPRDPLERLAAHARGRGGVERPRPSPAARAPGGRGKDLQAAGRARRGAGPARRSRRHSPRRATALICRGVGEKAAAHAGGPPVTPPLGRKRYRRLPSFFRFTYAQIFFVMSEGPIGLLPNSDS